MLGHYWSWSYVIHKTEQVLVMLRQKRRKLYDLSEVQDGDGRKYAMSELRNENKSSSDSIQRSRFGKRDCFACVIWYGIVLNSEFFPFFSGSNFSSGYYRKLKQIHC
mgnify:CR=1 FL=1